MSSSNRLVPSSNRLVPSSKELQTFNRESRRISREEVGTSRSSLLAGARAARWQRSTSRRAPALHRKSKCVRQGSRRCQWWACNSSTTLPCRTVRSTSTSRWRTPDGRNWPKLVAERSAQRSREEDDAPPAPPPRTRSAPGSPPHRRRRWWRLRRRWRRLRRRPSARGRLCSCRADI